MTGVIEIADTRRENLVKLVRKWADVNTDILLKEDCQVYAIPEIDGFIGYRVMNSNAVVFGDPICSPENKPILAEAFQKDCKAKNLGVVYTIASEVFTNWATKFMDAAFIEFGQKFILDPFQNPLNTTGTNAVRVRGKMKQALKEGVTIDEYKEDDYELEEQMMEVASAWLQNRKGLQTYLSHLHLSLFKDRYGKRLFYAKHEGHIIGMVVLHQIDFYKGWLLNNIMMIQDAPNGLSELLIVTALQELEKENCHYVLTGPAPLKKLGKISGIHRTLSLFIRWIYQGTRVIFHLDGYKNFWKKFHHKRENCYLIFPDKNLNFSSVKALMNALNMEIEK